MRRQNLSVSRRRRCLSSWLLLAEAGLFLLVARACLRLLRVSTIVRWIRTPLLESTADRPLIVEPCRWAVTAFSRNAPVRLVCFPQALALHAMLRRRRIVSDLLYGVARMDDGQLVAHVWLRHAGKVILGGETAGRFSVLDTWSPQLPHGR